MADTSLGQPLITDDELDGKRKRMSFNIERIARYCILILGICLGVAILGVVIYMLWTQASWREYAITAVFNGLPGIIVAFFVIVGIKKFKED